MRNATAWIMAAVFAAGGFAAGWLLKPERGTGRRSDRDHALEERVAAAESRAAILQEENAQLAKAAEEAAARAAQPPATPAPAPGKEAPAGAPESAAGQRFAFEGLSDKLKGLDWKGAGVAVSRLTPLLEELAAALAQGKPPPPSVADLQTYNAPLARLALTLRQQGLEGTGANGTFTHPAVVVNLVYEALREAGVPLDAAQEQAVADLGLRFLEEDRRRLASYTESTLGFRRVVEETDLKDRFFRDLGALLTDRQNAVLHPASARDRVAVDTFSSGVVWAQLRKHVPFRALEDLRASFVRETMTGLGLNDTARPALDQLAAEWAAGFPPGFLEEAPDSLAAQGMEKLDRVRTLASRQLQWMEAIPARVALTPEQRKALFNELTLLVPLRTG